MMQTQSPKRAQESESPLDSSELKQLEPKPSSAAATAAPSTTILPPSAPVSSLLPPLPPPQQGAQQHAPTTALANHQPTAMQALQQLLQSQAAANAVPALNNQNGSPFGATAPAHTLPLTAPTAQLVATQHPHQAIVPPQQSSNAGAMLSTPVSMENWTLEQLEAHVSLLKHLKQPISQTMEFLLADARRRREKKMAKRVANRKSASTSRARKKAQMKELMELNARLRRQALILALLPDLVIVVDVNGVVTFCSAQVERVLRHKPDDLVGSKLTDLLVPSSRKKLVNHIKEALVEKDLATTSTVAEADETIDDTQQEQKDQKRKSSSEQQLEAASVNESNTSDIGRLDESGLLDPSSAESSAAVAGAAVVSDMSSFPMAVVKVDAAAAKSTCGENSDSSTSRLSKQPSSLTNSSSLSRSLTVSSLGNSVSDGDSKNNKRRKVSAEGKLPSSDASNISSLSTEAKMQTANNNLEQNVRWHNRKMKDMHSCDGVNFFTDDVTGAAVTANNATARLSSLRVRHRESSSEDDSGYRESNDSRTEETESSSGDSSELNGRRKPLTPTCNICLIRDDLTTVWCEMTSSIRTRDNIEEEEGDANLSDAKPKAKVSSENKSCNGNEGETQPPRKQEVRELLLCLRPIRDGKEKAEAKYRFLPLAEKRQVSEGSESTTVNRDGQPSGASSSSDAGHAPHKKKRKGPSSDSEPSSNESRKRSKGASDVAESFMVMSNDKN